MAIKPIAPRIGDAGGSGGSGDVSGPSSATAGAMAIFSGTSGKVISEGQVPANYEVIIHSEDDFPPAVTGLDPNDANALLHPLVPGVSYLIDTDLATGIDIQYGLYCPNNHIYGHGVENTLLNYTGTERNFVITGSTQITDLTMNCAAGTHIDARGAGVFVGMNNVRIQNCVNMGYLDVGFWVARSGGYLNVTGTGYTHAGTDWVRCAASNWVEVISASTAGHDLGTTTPSFFLWNDCDLITGDAGAYSFSGLVDSGNIPIGGQGAFSNVRFSGVGNPLQNISEKDIRWDFDGCTGVPDSRNIGSCISIGNSDPIIITQNTWTDLNQTGAGSVVAGNNIELWELTNTVTGELTYRGVEEFRGLTQNIITYVPVGSQSYEFRVVKNDLPLSPAQVFGTSGDNASPTQVNIFTSLTAVTDDRVRLQVQNVDGNNNLTVTDFETNNQ